MSKITLDIYGLSEIKEYINPKRINKALAQGVGLAVLQIHSALRESVSARYTRPNDVNKALVRKAGLTETGKGFIKSGLEYKSPLVPLTRNVTDITKGNLREEKPRKGMVHSVTIKRGSQKKSHGKHGFGGFTQRVNGRLVMFERKQKATWIGKERAPLRVMFAPNVTDKINIMLSHDANVKRVIDKVENIILDEFIP